MKIIKRKGSNESKAAIDTPCDNCGAIYDLTDCGTCLCGKTLCPDCNCENIQFKNLLPNKFIIRDHDL